jgi:hypothetical protein
MRSSSQFRFSWCCCDDEEEEAEAEEEEAAEATEGEAARRLLAAMGGSALLGRVRALLLAVPLTGLLRGVALAGRGAAKAGMAGWSYLVCEAARWLVGCSGASYLLVVAAVAAINNGHPGTEIVPVESVDRRKRKR